MALTVMVAFTDSIDKLLEEYHAWCAQHAGSKPDLVIAHEDLPYSVHNHEVHCKQKRHDSRGDTCPLVIHDGNGVDDSEVRLDGVPVMSLADFCSLHGDQLDDHNRYDQESEDEEEP